MFKLACIQRPSDVEAQSGGKMKKGTKQWIWFWLCIELLASLLVGVWLFKGGWFENPQIVDLRYDVAYILIIHYIVGLILLGFCAVQGFWTFLVEIKGE